MHDAATAVLDQSNSSPGMHRKVITEIFGSRDTTPWAVLWLAFAWSVAEGIPGCFLLLNDLLADQPQGESILGAFFVAASIAGGSVWTWWTMIGSMPQQRRWQVFVASCLALVAARFLLPAPLLSLVAVFAWTMIGVTAVALCARYLLGVSLEPWQLQKRSELTIFLLLRYTLAAAVLAWFTRAISVDEQALLSTLEILAIALPLGIIVGLAFFALLWILARRYRWLYLAILIIGVLPISGATALYFAQAYQSKELVIAAIYLAGVSFVAHVILFGLPLIARGFRLHQIEPDADVAT